MSYKEMHIVTSLKDEVILHFSADVDRWPDGHPRLCCTDIIISSTKYGSFEWPTLLMSGGKTYHFSMQEVTPSNEAEKYGGKARYILVPAAFVATGDVANYAYQGMHYNKEVKNSRLERLEDIKLFVDQDLKRIELLKSCAKTLENLNSALPKFDAFAEKLNPKLLQELDSILSTLYAER